MEKKIYTYHLSHTWNKCFIEVNDFTIYSYEKLTTEEWIKVVLQSAQNVLVELLQNSNYKLEEKMHLNVQSILSKHPAWVYTNITKTDERFFRLEWGASHTFSLPDAPKVYD